MSASSAGARTPPRARWAALATETYERYTVRNSLARKMRVGHTYDSERKGTTGVDQEAEQSKRPVVIETPRPVRFKARFSVDRMSVAAPVSVPSPSPVRHRGAVSRDCTLPQRTRLSFLSDSPLFDIGQLLVGQRLVRPARVFQTSVWKKR